MLALQGVVGNEVVGLVLRSGGVAKVVLTILAIFSISSWAIVAHKFWSLHKADRHTSRFLDIFRRALLGYARSWRRKAGEAGATSYPSPA
jgi:biopolymer transport protein ExbB/TolQ